MTKIDWKHKLTSRKWWTAIATLVTGLILAFGGNDNTAQTVSGCIMSSAAVIAYTIGEGLADSAHKKEEKGDEEDVNIL